MAIELFDLILDFILVVLFGYSFYLGFVITKKLYGGRFTSALPPLVGAVAVLFMQRLVEFIFEFIGGEEAEIEFLFGLQILQVAAGFLLIAALYKLYQAGFATSGFFGGK